MKTIFIIFLLSFFILEYTYSQVYSNKVVGQKNEVVADSIKKSEYPYALPIWGKKVVEKGYDIPYSAGVSVNYLWQESSLIINNLAVGFNNGPMYNLDEIVRFDDATSWAGGVTVRPDIWLLPFLNVYGLLGYANTSTEINAGVYLPDINNEWQEITSFSTKAEFKAQVMGFGMTPTIGIGGGWLALDMNCAWTDVDALEKPVFTFVFGPRLGKSFKIKRPDQNIAFWVGGFRVKFSSDTKGSLDLSEVVDKEEMQIKVDKGIEKVGEKQVEVEDWWTGLTQVEQMNPINEAKYNTANRALETAGNILNSADAALNDGQSATVQYSLEKNLKDKWNFVVGSQYQFNKHWMIRAEYGFLGSRTQFLTSLQYRFRL
jgi:opacity protein-like surface antigen